MKYFAAIPLAASLAAAQMSVMSMAAAPAGGAVTHTVTVGGMKAAATPGGAATPILGYSPESITAAVGDMVMFDFMQKNHTVTQSSFANPCAKMANGMDSGFMPNANGDPGVTFNMTVPSTDPMWFYCKQKTGTHCGKGMVFAINAMTTGDKTFSAYKQLAIQQNGTDAGALSTAAIAAAGTATAAVASTVTINAGGAAGASATVAVGQGTTGDGQACTCQCLCGANSFPAMAAQNNFGGIPGMIA